MLQTVRKWTQINPGQLEEPFGSISGFIDQFGGLWTVGVGDVCFFLTMRCFNDAMFSNS